MNRLPLPDPKQPLLRHFLLSWTLGTVLVVWLSLVAVAWSTGYREAREFFDGQLVAVARLWLQSPPAQRPVLKDPALDAIDHEYLEDVAVLDWEDGRLVTDTHQLAAGMDLAALPQRGLATVTLHTEGGPSERRVYAVSLKQGGHDRRVAVLMDMGKRGELGGDIAEHVAQPAVLIFPLVALLLWWAIRRGLRPLDRLSSDVAALDGLAGERLDTAHRFREFFSTVQSINTLVDTLQRQAQRERAFASDVAHELRTPLAAMALQVSAAQADPSPHRLAQLEQISLRAGHILAQLLDLARAQRGDAKHLRAGQPPQPVDLGEVALQLVADHAQKAYEAEHELSLVRPDEPVALAVQPMLLELALRNLIDNALQHTPARTQVCVELARDEDGGVRLSVSDDGRRSAGEAQAPSAGLGLGLRLVERMAEEMGASLMRDGGVAPMNNRFSLCWRD